MQDKLKDLLLYEGYLNGDSGDWGLRNPDGPQAVSCIEALEAENERLRDALRDLLEDTQHSEHDCIDHDCPVKNARAALEEKQ